MNRLRILILLLAFIVLAAIVNPYAVDANILRMLGAGGGPGGGGGGGGACSNSLTFSAGCNAQYLGIGGLL